MGPAESDWSPELTYSVLGLEKAAREPLCWSRAPAIRLLVQLQATGPSYERSLWKSLWTAKHIVRTWRAKRPFALDPPDHTQANSETHSISLNPHKI